MNNSIGILGSYLEGEIAGIELLALVVSRDPFLGSYDYSLELRERIVVVVFSYFDFTLVALVFIGVYGTRGQRPRRAEDADLTVRLPHHLHRTVVASLGGLVRGRRLLLGRLPEWEYIQHLLPLQDGNANTSLK